jgi:predicted SAM-dependent methyltransferase
MKTIRVNIGCGRIPTEGWHNYDNSWSIRLAARPLLAGIMSKFNLLSEPQEKFISFAKSSSIRWADATKHIPEQDNSVDAIYSSHMLEHLDREDAQKFLAEARRILRHGGVIRLSVPNIKNVVENYIKDGDADKLIENTLLTRKKPKTVLEKIRYLLIGDRNHQWMYDAHSLCKLLLSVGFKDARAMEPGSTMIYEPGNLDLRERFPGSIYVEAINP